MRVRTMDEERAHKAALARIVARFHNEEITVDEKRKLIAEENEFYHGDHPRSLTPAKVLVTSPAWTDDEPVREWWKD